MTSVTPVSIQLHYQATCLRCSGPNAPPRKSGICRACRESTEQAYELAHKGPERAGLELFAEEFWGCWLCDYPHTKNPHSYRMHIHHIFGGAFRKHLRANLSRLCDRCHELAHKSQLRKEHVLWLKLKNDPLGYDRKALTDLLHRAPPRAQKPVQLIKQIRTTLTTNPAFGTYDCRD